LRGVSHVRTPGQFKVIAEITRVFFADRFGAPVPALIGGVRIVTHTIQTDVQIRIAAFTTLASAGLGRQLPFPTTSITMARHRLNPILIFLRVKASIHLGSGA
jgi:hypothetical protein